MNKPGRNDPCHCGSGKKYKKCCQDKSGSHSPTPAECNQLIALFNAGHYPDSGFAWKVLGAALQIQGKDSLAALRKTAELLPGDAVAHYNLGNILHERGRLNEAEDSYRRGLQLEPA